MFAVLRASSSRGVRAFSSTAQAAAKLPLRAHSETPKPADLLTKIGRNAEKKLGEKVPDWKSLTELYFKGTKPMSDAGMTPRERRYVMWALERYSHGDAPSTFIRPPTPAKKFRGWGPRVQNGKRVQ
ncbi:hypothetical protein CcaverHIS002_0202600 [Cutaneotrichosporon cavernicola]|uniref:Small ribosomal subunit protein mS41 n=1 Tax=Cutaneotrichosporon cavernicola TaxID=279322 RepID=A0AA48L2I0_9TREE|nr:uncharacterized protein CcaverHIS019_0202600 [Cutaneotrichosporon cavernicola]BEI81100.1 hypothetical protein CcaverHIS002_0202600 [Cutaneotrichosporon cavernicola]BEI88898.1 hypothetical protein CcaverHIS019_0202600 [Cutaneotrichosporon cavernicola]BEI96675.1 hypothetical protein CcaverHIS631_0202640 [Cutaneotrichosporon cavernicola]BEJ04447.1 hypothetical protein CcaverHIS641_0202640 [Cutaneotrichosporon cavernicola]